MSLEYALKGLEGVSDAEIHKTDITFEAAEITIMCGYLNSAADSIIMIRKKMRNIKKICFSLFLLTLTITIAPWMAGAALPFSSVVGVLNALLFQ